MALRVRRRDTAPQPIRRWDEGLAEHLAQLIQRLSDGDGGAPFIPLADIEETEDPLIVEADLPGVKREDVDVEVRGSKLASSGEIKERQRERILRQRTRTTGAFDHHIALPGDADAENTRPICATGS